MSARPERMAHCRYPWASSLPPQNRSAAAVDRREGPRDSKAASRRLGKRDGFPVRPESKDMENLGPYG